MDDKTTNSAQVTAPSERATEFAPVSGGPELTSAGTLLVVAYLAMWAVLMLMLWLGWRRQHRIDQRLNDLSRAVGNAPNADAASPAATSSAAVRTAAAKL